MHKHSKEALRKLAAQIGDIKDPAATPLAKRLNLAISKAWEEGNNEKAKVEQRLAAIERSDEHAITEKASAIAEERLATLAEEQQARCAACKEEFYIEVADRNAEMARVQKWLMDNMEGICTVMSIRIILIGDVDRDEVAEAVFYGIWHHLAQTDHGHHTQYSSYHIVSYLVMQPDGHYKLYVCVFDEEQYRRFSGASKVRSPEEAVAKGPHDFKAMLTNTLQQQE